jgi:membrane-anchored protein YejM (alkaline phosphatase superfamily)
MDMSKPYNLTFLPTHLPLHANEHPIKSTSPPPSHTPNFSCTITTQSPQPEDPMTTKRNILFITTDQMRFDALGCNGGKVAKTPVIDSLAHTGINYQRAHNQNVVCMPARATIMTGQYVSTHGVWMNGVCLPEDTPTVAHWLQDHGYHTGLLGKAHFEPWLGDPELF